MLNSYLPSVRGDSGFDGQFWRHDGRDSKHGCYIPSLVVVATDAPCETVLCPGVATYGKNLNVSLPRHFAAEHLFNWHRFKVRGVAAMNGFDRLAQFGKVFAHGRESATKSSTFHKREETPSAIAGVQRIVACVFTKL